MTDDEYKGIYNILNEIKENVNELKVSYTQNTGKLDSLGKELKKLSDEQEQLKSIIYSGNYGKNSLLEEVKLSHSKIHNLEGKLDTAKDDIAILEERWIKFLWALSIAVFLLIVSTILANTLSTPADSSPSENSDYILVYSFFRL